MLDALMERRGRGRDILMARIKAKEILGRLGEKPILIAILLFIIIWFLVSGASIMRGKNYKGEFLNSILVEAHGLLFDIFVFGILIVFFNKMGERRRNIKRWQEEIDDFRYWREKEATFRIVGNIKRLNRNGNTYIDLYDCFLKEANLSEADLRGAFLFGANLRGANLIRANLRGAVFFGANLERVALYDVNLEITTLYGADLRGAFLGYANLEGANLEDADLRGANLRGANLKEASLYRADLRGANLRGANLKEAYLGGADLRGAKNLTIKQLSQVEKLYQAKLGREFEKQMEERYPHLLEKPE